MGVKWVSGEVFSGVQALETNMDVDFTETIKNTNRD